MFLRRLLFFSLLAPCVATHAQTAPGGNDLAYIAGLRERDILTASGKAYFDSLIRHDAWMDDRAALSRWTDSKEEIKEGRAYILHLLADALFAESLHRMPPDRDRLLAEMINELGRNPTESDLLRLRARVDSILLADTGRQLEAAIPLEPDFILPRQTQGWSVYLSMMPSELPTGLISDRRSVIGKTVFTTLKDLFDLGLVEASVYDRVVKELQSSGSIPEDRAVRAMAEAQDEEEQRPRLYQKENAWFTALHEAGVFTQAEWGTALDRRHDLTPLTAVDALGYTARGTVINVDTLATGLTRRYQQVLSALSQVVPDFTYTELHADTVAGEGFDNWVAKDLLLRITVDGKPFKMRGHHHGYLVGEKASHQPQLAEDFYQIVNQVLNDRGSAYRLLMVYDQPLDSPRRGFVVLSQAQYDLWNSLSHLRIDAPFAAALPMTSAEILTALDFYQSVGLFNSLSADESEMGKNCVTETVIFEPANVLRCFPRTLVEVDWETGNLDNPYEQLTRDFAAASRGTFEPTDIRDSFGADWEAATTTFSFQLGSVSYAAELAMNRDWLDPAFLDLIFRAMTEQGIQGKFHYVFDDGQMGGYLFLEPAQYEALLARQPEVFLGD